MKNYILMADVIGSRDKNQVVLMKQFKLCVEYINHRFQGAVLSPLTITLGDEFQGVIKDLPSSIAILFTIISFSKQERNDFTFGDLLDMKTYLKIDKMSVFKGVCETIAIF